ncbi:MAG: bifunctional pantoate ligase / cytidylate kinase PanC-cmk [Phormidesmis priestleyi Ana]|uniref:Bifunctional pantoate ligase/cytidylate kinase n=1 Tax=Phormidesmis priestleyi Ana TaxID=1666911 RepID=A0A0P8DFF2_9CYAN|nr:MAG: bifunctional pantoate ligase / cytidylate kinase PanC-cmk [Phormidesmis priestleyi Ana]
MRLFHITAELRHYLKQLEKRENLSEDSFSHGVSEPAIAPSIGLVPTMGALHAGHLSLIERSRQECDVVIVSIFVNPLQFGPTEDLDQYPRPTAEDTALCEAANVDVLFMPSSQILYGTPYPNLSTVTQVIPPASMTNRLCGRTRPTHFQGVATVVTKLLNIVRPTRAYFGQKDAQQVAILKRLVQDLNLPGEMIVCPIVRAADGLALSSRNQYLSGSERQQATVLYKSLSAVQKTFEQGERGRDRLLQVAKAVLASEPTIKLDYLELVHPDTLETLQVVNTVGMMTIAAYVGKARLLDNVVLESPHLKTSNLDKTELKKTEQPQRTPIIAIDGPAGAGKSTVARQVAHNLGLLYLDTGAMYRALTWFVLQQGIHPTDADSVAQLLPSCQIRLTASIENNQPQPPNVSVNGQDITQAIRTSDVTSQVSTIAAQPAVRTKLVEQQQEYGQLGGIVADGRDIGTQVFPNAELKIYLTASVQERAQRRYRDLVQSHEQSHAQGHAQSHAQSHTQNHQDLPAMSELVQAIAERDHKDSTRAVSPLCKADDAIEIVTDHLTAEQVIEQITDLYHKIDHQIAITK